MEYQEKDLPVTLNEGDSVTVGGQVVRFDESGGARDVMINDEWTARATLFPGMDYVLETGSGCFKCTAGASDMLVEKA